MIVKSWATSMTISAKEVQELRKMSGAGMMGAKLL